jgi:branched-chain amino acid transport system ATP-binding protein
MLEVKNLRISYNRVPAVTDASLKLTKGEIVALVGGNGNGKSSILRAIAGLNPVDHGVLTFDDIDITRHPPYARVRLGLAMVPEGRRLFPRLTVERNLLLGAYTRDDPREVAESLDYAYGIFPILKDRRRQLAGTMSGGEQQMLAVARGLMAKPKLLMLDEPSWGIAPKMVLKILDTIQLINQTGVTILLVEQNLQHSLRISHRAYVVQTGRVVLEGKASDLIGNDLVKHAYLGM